MVARRADEGIGPYRVRQKNRWKRADRAACPYIIKSSMGAENRRGGVKFLLVFYGKNGYNILYARSGMPRSRDPYLEEF